MFFVFIRANPSLHFVGALGVSLLPRRDQTGKNVNAVAEFAVKTEIKIRAETFGDSVHSRTRKLTTCNCT